MLSGGQSAGSKTTASLARAVRSRRSFRRSRIRASTSVMRVSINSATCRQGDSPRSRMPSTSRSSARVSPTAWPARMKARRSMTAWS